MKKLSGMVTPASAAKAAVGESGVICWTRGPVAAAVVQVSCTGPLLKEVTVMLRTKGHGVGGGVGWRLGDAEGDAVVGEAEGNALGCEDGAVVGFAVVGPCVGENVSVGVWVGWREGAWVGRALGAEVMGTHAATDVLDGGKMVVKPKPHSSHGSAPPLYEPCGQVAQVPAEVLRGADGAGRRDVVGARAAGAAVDRGRVGRVRAGHAAAGGHRHVVVHVALKEHVGVQHQGGRSIGQVNGPAATRGRRGAGRRVVDEAHRGVHRDGAARTHVDGPALRGLVAKECRARAHKGRRTARQQQGATVGLVVAVTEGRVGEEPLGEVPKLHAARIVVGQEALEDDAVRKQGRVGHDEVAAV